MMTDVTAELVAVLEADLTHTRAFRDGLRAGFRMGESGEVEAYETALNKMLAEITDAARALAALQESGHG